ncbi:hypothetical protein JYU34_007519 [Plutella xylostella]|uniref:Uncharacterized protein n=1 Tax=Plutella xylostella TaxID=51655 RepID=A0ABQ7QQK9_PLUXY|nr:hypothetical protein JYU34_007519 [Plutella xylostella]
MMEDMEKSQPRSRRKKLKCAPPPTLPEAGGYWKTIRSVVSFSYSRQVDVDLSEPLSEHSGAGVNEPGMNVI